MPKASKTRVAEVHATPARRSAPGSRVASKTAFLMSSHKRLSGWLKYRSSCSTVEEEKKILATATVMDGSALPTIDALPSCIAISKAPPRSGLPTFLQDLF